MLAATGGFFLCYLSHCVWSRISIYKKLGDESLGKEEAGKVYTGTFFNKIHKNDAFYKITNKDECHYGFQYKDGLNIDTIPFNPKSYEEGGLHFAGRDNIAKHAEHGIYIRKVEIPDDAYIYVNEDKTYKANKIILGPKATFRNSELWGYESFRRRVLEDQWRKRLIESPYVGAAMYSLMEGYRGEPDAEDNCKN